MARRSFKWVVPASRVTQSLMRVFQRESSHCRSESHTLSQAVRDCAARKPAFELMMQYYQLEEINDGICFSGAAF